MFDDAVRCIQRGDFSQARELLLKIVAVRPRDFDANHMLGIVFGELQAFDRAEQSFRTAYSVDPKYPPLFKNWGMCLSRQNRFNEAIEKFNTAISLAPNFPPVYSDRGNAFKELGFFDEAIRDHSRAISLAPQAFGFYHNRGNALVEKGEYIAALADFDRAMQLSPQFADALYGRGNVLVHLKRYEEALAAYDRVLSLNPDLDCVEGARLHTKMHLCKWDNLEREIDHLKSAVRAGKANCAPFVMLSLSDSAEDQLHCAKAWVSVKHPVATAPGPFVSIGAREKIRVGYVSPDFGQHAVSYLAAGVFEKHDKDRFEIFGFSLAQDDKSALRQRLQRSFDGFFDLHRKNDGDAVERIRAAQLDIVVDLGGHTQGARPSLFFLRPAAIAVNFLGFAGTLGSRAAWDYIIADRTVIPDETRQFFEEKVVRLPHTFMPRDDRGERADQATVRADYGLPEEAVVFCCFNNAYKIDPGIFDRWMNILRKVDGSVLWLSDAPEPAKANLRREAGARGIDPARLIFARRVPSSSEHLARHRLADLFLDTLPYNAHTTTSDALWAGLPVLTLAGDGFAGRVAASLLEAAGLPDLVTRSRDAYEIAAVDLALNAGKRHAIRDRLQSNHSMMPVFDTERHTRSLEAAYEAMVRRHQAGQPPDHIDVQSS